MKPELGWQNGHAGRSRKTASFPALNRVSLPMDGGLARERELFGELVTSPESAAMRHIFFAERLAAKIKDLPKDTATRDIRKGHYRVKGGGIAMCFAGVGIPVVLVEVDDRRWSVALALSARITP